MWWLRVGFSRPWRNLLSLSCRDGVSGDGVGMGFRDVVILGFSPIFLIMICIFTYYLICVFHQFFSSYESYFYPFSCDYMFVFYPFFFLLYVFYLCPWPSRTRSSRPTRAVVFTATWPVFIGILRPNYLATYIRVATVSLIAAPPAPFSHCYPPDSSTAPGSYSSTSEVHSCTPRRIHQRSKGLICTKTYSFTPKSTHIRFQRTHLR